MTPLLNRPLLEHTLDYLKKHNVNDFIFTLGYLPEGIQNYFGNGSKFGVKISYLVEEFSLGSAGAIKNAERFLDDFFIVVNGDIFTEIDLTAMANLHRQNKAIATIALAPVDDPTPYGVVETDAENKVKRFLEKPGWDEVTTNMINAGIYIMESEILSYIPGNMFFTFERDVFPSLLERGQAMYGYPSEAYWTDIGTPQKYLELHHHLLNRYDVDKSTKFEGVSSIHPSARTEGPVIIGAGCFIGKDSVIKGPAVLGSGCRIEEAVVIEGAVLWQNCKVGKGAKLRNCVVASNCYIGENCEILDSCVLGDNVIIGKGNKLSQGIQVWPDKSIEPDAVSF
jgi:mannose-1-phosphate guanylyltransferase